MWFSGVFSRVRCSVVRANLFRRDVNTINDTSWAFVEFIIFIFSVFVFGRWAIINSPTAEAMESAGKKESSIRLVEMEKFHFAIITFNLKRSLAWQTRNTGTLGRSAAKNKWAQWIGPFITILIWAIYEHCQLPVATWQWVKQAQSTGRTAVDVTV